MFEIAFREKNEIDADRCIPYLGLGVENSPMDWMFTAAFAGGMPTATNRSHHWIFTCIALLMHAALPVRSTEIQDSGLWPNKWHYTPSSQARERMAWNANQPNAYQMPGSINIMGPNRRARTRIPVMFFDPSVGNMAWLQNHTQMDFLVLVASILDHIRAAQAVVSKAWYLEIWNVLGNMHADRLQLQNTYQQAHTTMVST